MNVLERGKRTTKNSLGLRGVPDNQIQETLRKLGRPEIEVKRFKPLSTRQQTLHTITLNKNADVNTVKTGLSNNTGQPAIILNGNFVENTIKNGTLANPVKPVLAEQPPIQPVGNRAPALFINANRIPLRNDKREEANAANVQLPIIPMPVVNNRPPQEKIRINLNAGNVHVPQQDLRLLQNPNQINQEIAGQPIKIRTQNLLLNKAHEPVQLRFNQTQIFEMDQGPGPSYEQKRPVPELNPLPGTFFTRPPQVPQLNNNFNIPNGLAKTMTVQKPVLHPPILVPNQQNQAPEMINENLVPRQTPANMFFLDNSYSQYRMLPQQEDFIPVSSVASTSSGKRTETPDKKQYHELLALENSLGIVANSEPFDCSICFVTIEENVGVVLRNCLHKFCKECLIQTITHAADVNIKCPNVDGDSACDDELQDREIRALLSEVEYEKYLMRTLRFAENNMQNAFHCKKPDCIGWCVAEDQMNQFRCPVCNLVNCIACAAIHTGQNCKEYQEDLKLGSDDNARTLNILKKLVSDGEAMHCPNCNIVIMKRTGCDWIKCIMCQTEICWATKMRRWGPAGVGDTSDGCKCKVDGKLCHPNCRNCH